MDTQEIIRNIKKDLRTSMNGVASTYMRENGVQYKLNFGVELPRLKELAAGYPVNHDLAQTLWKENIRECKLLAGMLQPIETFFPEIADIWVENISNVEIAQHTVQNLFCRLPYASQKAYEWIATDDEMYQVCGFLILARLFMQGMVPNERAKHEFLDQAWAASRAPQSVRRAALSAIRKFQELNEEACEEGEKVLEDFLIFRFVEK